MFHILVADDDKNTRKLIGAVLEAEGYTVSSDTGWETGTVHVGRLRKRFEGWPEFEIQSVRGLGYKAVKKA